MILVSGSHQFFWTANLLHPEQLISLPYSPSCLTTASVLQA